MTNKNTAPVGGCPPMGEAHNNIGRIGLGIVGALLIAVACIGWLGAGAASAAVPTVSIDAPATASYTSAQVSGTVNPQGNETHYSFEYSTDGVTWTGFGFETPFAASLPASSGSTHVSGEFTGLTPGAQYFVRLAAVDFVDSFPEGAEILSSEPNPSLTTLAVALPSTSISAPTLVTGNSAHFSGQINPGAPSGNPAAFEVNYRFECTPECPGLNGASIPADNTSHTVEADATGLLYNTNYEVKLIAVNAGGEATQTQTFKTAAVAPEVESRPVGTFTDATAIIGGSVDPNGSATSYTIEYAANAAFSSPLSVPATHDAAAGSGQTPVVVSQPLGGLEPDSTYYFRITATNAIGSVVSAVQSFQTRSSEAAAASCPNEKLRVEDNSVALPDCRAYELVTPDSNHALVSLEAGGRASEDGEKLLYVTADAPLHARGAQPLANYVRATRDPVMGWRGESLIAALPEPVGGYFSFLTTGVSSDLSSTFSESDQPLSGGGQLTNGRNGFIGHPDGTYTLITDVASPSFGAFGGGDANFSHVYFYSSVSQLSSDPTGGGNLYSWSQAEGLKLVGILPDGTPAPGGATLEGNIIGSLSADGNRAVFVSEGKLYLHIEDAASAEVSASQRTTEPDPNPGPGLAEIAQYNPQLLAGITDDGSKVLFVAHSELTNDANTGSSGGVATDAGADLYSYDVASGRLTDLTVDTDPADAVTGADVKQVLGATPDGSYIYFTATGDLAAGATPGQTSLYAWHEGHIVFVADEDGFVVSIGTGGVPRFYVAADGKHAVFASTESLTGYDNTDPVTGQPHSEVYESTLGVGIQCASCHPDGAPPTADSLMPFGGVGATRVANADGSRVFFQSTDAILPRTSNGLQKVFEYSGGKVTLLSPADGVSNAGVLATSASGNDVFIVTYDELVPNPSGGNMAVYDARVDGGFPVSSRQECSGAACRGPLGSAPVFGAPASSALSGTGNLASPAPKASVKPKAKKKTAAQIRAAKLKKALKSCKPKHKKQRSACEKKARHAYGRNK
jgi:hypothetical protein